MDLTTPIHHKIVHGITVEIEESVMGFFVVPKMVLVQKKYGFLIYCLALVSAILPVCDTRLENTAPIYRTTAVEIQHLQYKEQQ